MMERRKAREDVVASRWCRDLLFRVTRLLGGRCEWVGLQGDWRVTGVGSVTEEDEWRR